MQATCKPPRPKQKQSTYDPSNDETNMEKTEMLPGYTYIYKKKVTKCNETKRLPGYQYEISAISILTRRLPKREYYESDSEYESSSSSRTTRLMTLLSNKSNANRRAGNLK
jgi:hypothetical protein